MFEESLLESAHLLRTNNRWPAFASIALQAAIAATIIAIPLFRPSILPVATLAATLAPPSLVHHTPPPVQRTNEEASTATVLPAPPLSLPPRISPATEPTGLIDPSLSSATTSLIGMTTTLSPALSLSNATSPKVAIAAPAEPLAVSTGVATGLLLAPIHLVYPVIARTTHIEGTVVIHAIISKDGRIVSANVVSGPSLLQGAALEAVRAAHYRPYSLNGEPTEVETTFNINFHMTS